MKTYLAVDEIGSRIVVQAKNKDEARQKLVDYALSQGDESYLSGSHIVVWIRANEYFRQYFFAEIMLIA